MPAHACPIVCRGTFVVLYCFWVFFLNAPRSQEMKKPFFSFSVFEAKKKKAVKKYSFCSPFHMKCKKLKSYFSFFFFFAKRKKRRFPGLFPM
jgi:hypothetical protein